MKITFWLSMAALAALAGCGSDSIKRPPPTDVRFFDAAANLAPVSILREEFSETVLNFGGGSRKQFDSGPFDFHLETTFAGSSTATRVVSLSEDLSPDLVYTFVAVAPGGQPELLVSSADKFPENSSNARFSAIFANPMLGDVDVYVVAAGTPLDTVAAKAHGAFRDSVTFEVTPASYRIYLTPHGDPSTILYESADFDAQSGIDNALIICDPGGQITSDIELYMLESQATPLIESGLQARVRAVQGISDGLDRDLLLDGDPTPVISSLPFGVLSDYVPLTTGVHSLDLTPVATPGTVELTTQIGPIAGNSYIAAFSGDPATVLEGKFFAEDMRRIVGQSTLRMIDIAGLFAGVNVYIAPPGTDITKVQPAFNISPPGISSRVRLAPGDFEITLQDATTAAILAGPVTITSEDGGLYGMLLLNAPGGSTIDLQYLYDLAP